MHRRWLALVVALVAVSARAAPEDDFNEGKRIGDAQRDQVVGAIKSGEAAKQQPTYNTDPPEKGVAAKGNFSAAAAEKKAACEKTPDEPQCTGISIGSTPQPKEVIPPSDPVWSGEAVARNPSLILNDIGKAYSDCRVGEIKLIKPATFGPDACTTNTNAWSKNTCRKTLEVVPRDRFSCEQGRWMAATQGSLWSALYNKIFNTFADAQCDLTRTDGTLAFAIGACTDCPSAGPMQVVTLDVSRPQPPIGELPVQIGTLVTKYGIAVNVFEDGPGCVETGCSKTLHFMPDGGFDWNYTCPAGMVHGPDVSWQEWTCGSGDAGCWDESKTGPTGTCFAPSEASAPGTVLTTIPGGFYAPGPAATRSGYSPNAPGGYGRITLSFKRPMPDKKAGDHWQDDCEPFAKMTSASTLPDEGTSPTVGVVMPSNLASQCRRISSVCLDGPSTRMIDGVEITRPCWAFENRFDCTTLAATSNCDLPRFKSCAPTGPATCTATDGEAPPHCLSVVTNLECRLSDPVYAPVTDCGTTTFCIDGSCVNTSYTNDADFAQTVATLEAAKEAGRTLDTKDMRIFKGTSAQCENWPTDCCKTDPTDLGRRCDAEDKEIAVNRSAGKCHEVEAGWCASRRLFGACTRRMNTYCCYPSKLSRIINEQGRAQLGWGWGNGRNPDCSGFSIDDMAKLDFSKMDFSEFIADIKPTLPDAAKVTSDNDTKSGNCYYGDGKC